MAKNGVASIDVTTKRTIVVLIPMEVDPKVLPSVSILETSVYSSEGKNARAEGPGRPLFLTGGKAEKDKNGKSRSKKVEACMANPCLVNDPTGVPCGSGPILLEYPGSTLLLADEVWTLESPVRSSEEEGHPLAVDPCIVSCPIAFIVICSTRKSRE